MPAGGRGHGHLPGAGHPGEGVMRVRDIQLNGLLLPAGGIDGGDSAVAPDSWARIKASFSQ